MATQVYKELVNSMQYMYFCTIGPVGSGRTYNIIKNAPENAIIIAANAQHAKSLMNACHKQDRKDLKIEVWSSYANKNSNLRPPQDFQHVLFDHYTLNTMFLLAANRVTNLIEEIKYLEERNRDLARQLEDKTEPYN